MASNAEIISTKAVLSPAQKKPGLIAQAPTDLELRKLIYNREESELSQNEPAQNSFIVTRVEEATAKILDPTQNRLWFRAQITGKISEDLFLATLSGHDGILFEGTLLLKQGGAWENSAPLITVNKSSQLHSRSKDMNNAFNQIDAFPIPVWGGVKEGDGKHTLSEDLILQLAQKFYPEVANDPSIVVIIGNYELDPFAKSNKGIQRTPIEGTNLENQATPKRGGPTLRDKAGGKFPGAPSRDLAGKFATTQLEITNKGPGNKLKIVKPGKTTEQEINKQEDISSTASSRKFLFGQTAEEEQDQKEKCMVNCQEYILSNPE